MAVLRVVAVGVKVGRAVGVREGRRVKGVGHKAVDAPHQKVVGQVFFQLHALGPAVVAKDLAHRVAGLARLDGRGAGRQVAQLEMVKSAVPRLGQVAGFGGVLTLGQHLAADVVDAGHILTVQPAEVMPQAGAGAGVGVAVLDHMADVPHAVRAAPAADLARKVLPHQPGHSVHVGVADAGSLAGVGGVIPQKVEQVCPACAQAGFQLRRQGAGKGQILVGAKQAFLAVEVPVAQLRLVGEKSHDGAAEIGGIVLPVRLVHRVDQQAAAVRVQHIDVIPVWPAVAGKP